MKHSSSKSGCGCLLFLLLVVLPAVTFTTVWTWLEASSSPDNISSYAGTEAEIHVSAAYTPKEVNLPRQDSSYPITPLDIAGQISHAAPPAEDAAYTILMVLNGSDLETQNGFASDDVLEILKSGLDSDKINFLILAGGTLEWKNPWMPNREYAVYRVIDGALETLCYLGSQDLANPALLAGFLDLGYRMYPARNTALIFWNHGGGAVIGCGYDEVTEHSLLLSQFETALASSQAVEKPLEFIGFDACLMANLETACVCSRYANYLIASEELEPGSGWDYRFLSSLSQTPDMTGEEIGREIGESYISYYSTLAGRMLSVRAAISVIDLRHVPAVVQEVESLAAEMNQKLMTGGYNRIAKMRGMTMDFAGTGGEDDYDLIDLVDFCRQLSKDFPKHSAAVIEAMEEAVTFCGSTENVNNANGLTVYFPFYAKLSAYEYLPVYEEIDVMPHYTELIVNFARILNGDSIAVSSGFDPSAIAPEWESGNCSFRLTAEELENVYAVRFALWKVLEKRADGTACCVQLEESGEVNVSQDGEIAARFDGYQFSLNGNPCCLCEISRTPDETRYYIPAVLNGQDVRLMVTFSEKYPNGSILGAAPETGRDSFPIPQRGLISVRSGDKIRLRYPAALFSTEGGKESSAETAPDRYEGEEWIVKGSLKLEKEIAEEGEYLYGFVIVDTQRNEHPTGFIRMRVRYGTSGLGAA